MIDKEHAYYSFQSIRRNVAANHFGICSIFDNFKNYLTSENKLVCLIWDTKEMAKTRIARLRRNWAFRLSVVFNMCVLLYSSAHFGSLGLSIKKLSTNWTSLAEALIRITESEKYVGTTKEGAEEMITTIDVISKMETTTEITLNQTEGNLIRNRKYNEPYNKTMGLMTLQEAIPCTEKSSKPKTVRTSHYWFLYNYVPMSASVKCWESVTYTTHADYTFLDNMSVLMERWQAPVSIAMYAPGNDFPPTLDAIKYLRSCGSPLMSQLITFHIFFNTKHIPESIPSYDEVMEVDYNCTLPPPWIERPAALMYKSRKKLQYPINVGRNIARRLALTHYVLPSDIELYPSRNLARKFIEMIRKSDQSVFFKPRPKVFPLSIFEVDARSQPPTSKQQLVLYTMIGRI